MLRLALLHKADRSEQVLHFWKNVGLHLVSRADDALCVTNFPLAVVACDNTDLHQLFAADLVDLAVVDSACVTNAMQVVCRLGFCKNKLQIVAATDTKTKNLALLSGKTIATPYAKTLSDYLKQNGVRAKIVETPNAMALFESGTFEYTCCLVGDDGRSKNWHIVDTIAESEAVLVKNANLSPQKQLILDELLARIQATLAAENKCELTLCAPTTNCAEIKHLLGENAVCIATDQNMSLARAVVDEVAFWDALEKLKTLGAKQITLHKIDRFVK